MAIIAGCGGRGWAGRAREDQVGIGDLGGKPGVKYPVEEVESQVGRSTERARGGCRRSFMDMAKNKNIWFGVANDGVVWR
jgi:hypothetical protein